MIGVRRKLAWVLVAAALGVVAAVAIGERAGKQGGVAGKTAPGYNQRQSQIAIGAGDSPGRRARSATVAGGCASNARATVTAVGCGAGLDFKAETRTDYIVSVR